MENDWLTVNFCFCDCHHRYDRSHFQIPYPSFLAILGVSVIFGLIGGIPLVKHGKVLGIADVVSAGFAGTFTSIGIVIIMGA